jgi:hypothetical protein
MKNKMVVRRVHKGTSNLPSQGIAPPEGCYRTATSIHGESKSPAGNGDFFLDSEKRLLGSDKVLISVLICIHKLDLEVRSSLEAEPNYSNIRRMMRLGSVRTV